MHPLVDVFKVPVLLLLSLLTKLLLNIGTDWERTLGLLAFTSVGYTQQNEVLADGAVA